MSDPYQSPAMRWRQEEEDRIAALRAAGKMRRIRIISNGQVLGSMEIPHGYRHIGCATGFRLTGSGDAVVFGYTLYQIDQEGNPVASVDKDEDEGFFTLEQFLDLPVEWIDRLSEFPDFQAVRPKRIIDMGERPT